MEGFAGGNGHTWGDDEAKEEKGKRKNEEKEKRKKEERKRHPVWAMDTQYWVSKLLSLDPVMGKIFKMLKFQVFTMLTLRTGPF